MRGAKSLPLPLFLGRRQLFDQPCPAAPAVQGWQCTQIFEGHSHYVMQVVFNPKVLGAVCIAGMRVCVWCYVCVRARVSVCGGRSSAWPGFKYFLSPSFPAQDTNTFASASLDRTIKVWSLGSPTPNLTLEGHEKGVNCVDYYGGGGFICSFFCCI